MGITQIRRLLRKRGLLALPFVTGFLTFQYAKRHKAQTAGVLALCIIGFGLFAFCAGRMPHPAASIPLHAPQTPGSAAEADYSVTDLGAVEGYAESGANSINKNGLIVGYVRNGDKTACPVFWRKGKAEALEMPGMSYGYAESVNSSGLIVGTCFDAGGQPHAILWRNGKMQELTCPDGYSASAAHISDKGWICGQTSKKNEYPSGEAALWINGRPSVLPFRGYYSAASGVNDKGEVVGTSQISGWIYESYRFYDNKVEDLPSLGGYGDYASAINEKGQVVGHSEYEDKFAARAVLITGKSIRDLGTLGGQESSANALNAKAEVIGWSQDRQGAMQPFLWKRDNMMALNDLIPKNSGWRLTGATGINNQGQIVGRGMRNGQVHAFLMTPNR